jgi:hypothetical protein
MEKCRGREREREKKSEQVKWFKTVEFQDSSGDLYPACVEVTVLNGHNVI